MKKILALVLCLISFDSFCQTTDWIKSKDSTKIFYTYNISDTDKLTLIFVHGWCCSHEFWKYQVEHFSDKYNTAVLDLAGHGLSEKRKKYRFNQ